MNVESWLQSHPDDPVLVYPDMELEALLAEVVTHPGVTELYVVDEEGRIIGRIDARRLAHRALEEHRPVHTRRQIFERVAGGRADEIMNRHFPYAELDEQLVDVLHRLLESGAWELPVLDRGGRPLGCIRLQEVLKYLLNNML